MGVNILQIILSLECIIILAVLLYAIFKIIIFFKKMSYLVHRTDNLIKSGKNFIYEVALFITERRKK